MIEKTSKKRKRGSISEEDISTLLQRYTATTLLALLQEISQSSGVKLNWEALVKRTSTGITNAREYQMLWRHLAYRHELFEKFEDGAEPLDDDSDLEYELEPSPSASSEASTEAAACVKVLIASGFPSDSSLQNSSRVEAPLTINIPNGQSFRASSENTSATCSMRGMNITVPVSVQKQILPAVTPAETSLEGNGSSNANLPARRKRKPWSEAEDLELIAAVQKCGVGNWANILRGDFKGDRSASQLAQRWTIIKRRLGTLNGEGTSTASQLSESQLATRSALSLALDMPNKNLAAACTNNPGLKPTSSNSALPATSSEASVLAQSQFQQGNSASVEPQNQPQQCPTTSVSAQNQPQKGPITDLASQHRPQKSPITALPSQNQPQKGPVSALPSQYQPQNGPISALPSQNQTQKSPVTALPSQNQPQKGPISSLPSQDQPQRGSSTALPPQNQPQQCRTPSVSAQNQPQQFPSTSVSAQNQPQKGPITPLSTQNQTQKGPITALAAQNQPQQGPTTSVSAHNQPQKGLVTALPAQNPSQQGPVASVQVPNQSQQGPVTTKTSPRASAGSTLKGRVTMKKSEVKSFSTTGSILDATAVAAGARIGSPKAAASLLKAAQSKNAIHIITTAGPSVKPLIPNGTSSPVVTSPTRHPGSVRSAKKRVEHTPSASSTSLNVSIQQCNAVTSSPKVESSTEEEKEAAGESSMKEEKEAAGEIQGSVSDGLPKDMAQENGACMPNDESGEEVEEHKPAVSNQESELKNVEGEIKVSVSDSMHKELVQENGAHMPQSEPGDGVEEHKPSVSNLECESKNLEAVAEHPNEKSIVEDNQVDVASNLVEESQNADDGNNGGNCSN